MANNIAPESPPGALEGLEPERDGFIRRMMTIFDTEEEGIYWIYELEVQRGNQFFDLLWTELNEIYKKSMARRCTIRARLDRLEAHVNGVDAEAHQHPRDVYITARLRSDESANAADSSGSEGEEDPPRRYVCNAEFIAKLRFVEEELDLSPAKTEARLRAELQRGELNSVIKSLDFRAHNMLLRTTKPLLSERLLWVRLSRCRTKLDGTENKKIARGPWGWDYYRGPFALDNDDDTDSEDEVDDGIDYTTKVTIEVNECNL